MHKVFLNFDHKITSINLFYMSNESARITLLNHILHFTHCIIFFIKFTILKFVKYFFMSVTLKN